MDEQKRTSGRDSQGAAPGDRRSRRAEPIGTMPKEHLAESNGRRRRDEETDAKMRLLWAILGVLVVILVAAIVYEIVLGNGTRETGSQRMSGSAQETETDASAGVNEENEGTSETEEDVVIVTDSDGESEAVAGEDAVSEQESDLSQDFGSELAADQDDGSEETSAGDADGTADSDATQETDAQAEASASQNMTLAGLGN
ncbi:MAG: MSCRAMM family adhesin SdrC [Lachnospiraceae bacterium]|nr:MSCRAMM family adhesin SdrC [Lachnospiraceae bacterium]